MMTAAHPRAVVEQVDISNLPLLNTDLETPDGGSARRRGLPRPGLQCRLLPLMLAQVQLLHRKYVLPCSSPFSIFFLSCYPPLRDWLIDQRQRCVRSPSRGCVWSTPTSPTCEYSTSYSIANTYSPASPPSQFQSPFLPMPSVPEAVYVAPIGTS
jgi:hypothetical protein